jgi:hypothetical protein
MLMMQDGVADHDGAAYKAFSMLLRKESSAPVSDDASPRLAAGGVVAAGLSLFAASPHNASSSAGGH